MLNQIMHIGKNIQNIQPVPAAKSLEENKLQNNENLPVFNVWNKFTITFLKKIVISVLFKYSS